MKEEVLAAVMFLVRFIEKSETFPRNQIENFKAHLTALLMKRFEKHWFPELPARGQGYRCIRVNGLTPVDRSLALAARKCGLSYSDLSLPTELTVWVDPSEVCYRLGESEGSYCTLATFPSPDTTSRSSSDSDLSETCSSPSSSPPSTPVQGKPKKMNLSTMKSPQHHYHHLHNHLSHNQPHHNHHNQRVSIDNVAKYRTVSFSNGSPSTVAPLRSKPAPLREMNNHLFPNRPSWREMPFLLPPSVYRNYHNNYNSRQYKNVVKV